jgi:hypothetical protein
MPKATRNHKDLTGPEIDRRLPLELNSERPLPAEKELIFIVRVPGELAVELRYADDGVVGASEVGGLPRLRYAAGRESDVDLARAYFAYSTALVSRMTVILI